MINFLFVFLCTAASQNEIHSVKPNTSGDYTSSNLKESEDNLEVSYPFFPLPLTNYGKYITETFNYVERWIFQVVRLTFFIIILRMIMM